MIRTNIDLRPYKLTAIGGEPACGKSFIMGLFVDELAASGKNVCYINVEGTPLRFDTSSPNVRCFVYFRPDDIIDFYKQMNSLGEEIYIFIDSIGAINLRGYISNDIGKAKQLRHFLMILRQFNNIKTIFSFNYNRNFSVQQKSYINNHTYACDKFIDVRKYETEQGSYKYDIYLNENFLSSLDDLALDPKIRTRERKISDLVD